MRSTESNLYSKYTYLLMVFFSRNLKSVRRIAIIISVEKDKKIYRGFQWRLKPKTRSKNLKFDSDSGEKKKKIMILLSLS